MNAPADISLLDRPTFYFIGIGGIGMSALARFFHQRGKEVGGYDKTPSPLTDQLLREGMDIHFFDDPQTVKKTFKAPSNTLVIYTPAIPEDHAELNYFRNNGFDVLKRSAVLGLISTGFYTIAIAGTHGKTTTSSIVTHLLQQAGKKFIAFVGGISQNYNTNLLVQPDADIMVTEADEYDRSFLTLHPDIALITSIDPDHLDIYGNTDEMKKSYRQFAAQLKPGGTLVTTEAGNVHFQRENTITYGVRAGACHAENIRILNGKYHFDLVSTEFTIENCELGLPGRHNLENAVGAVAIAGILSIPAEKIKNALASYKGVKRRFDVQVNSKEIVYIDDYAHHPSEIRACLESVREMYPGKRITGIFQPHLYSRTRDFADGFAESLDLLDELLMLDIYPAREKPIPGVDSEMIMHKMKLGSKTLVSKGEVLGAIEKLQPEVLVTLGAGDIDRLVEPIAESLRKKYA